MVVVVADISKFLANFFLFAYNRLLQLKQSSGRKRRGLRARKGTGKGNGHENEDEEEEEEEEEDIVLVPAGWIFLLLVLFPFIASFFLAMYEGWQVLESIYFCFISVLTIGLGDVTPTNESCYLVTAFFIIFGILLTSVVLDLVVGEYIAKVHYFGRRLGAAKQQALAAVMNIGSAAMGWMSFYKQLASKDPEGCYQPRNVRTIEYIDESPPSEFEDIQLELRSIYKNNKNNNTSHTNKFAMLRM